MPALVPVLASAAAAVSPVYTARLLLAHGQLLRRTSNRKDAVERLRPANALFLGLRAAPFIRTGRRGTAGRRRQLRSRAVADFLHLIRAQPGDNRCTGDRIQGVELFMDVLRGQLGGLALVPQLKGRGGHESGGRHQQRCPD